ncbi:hypothetical protein [Neisseria sp.]|nr:hypothetical protein [Neisseria sp.]MDO4906689.1 hypothetical protein [Neisseria sp.]
MKELDIYEAKKVTGGRRLVPFPPPPPDFRTRIAAYYIGRIAGKALKALK